ncbi:Uncharacterized protein Forpe1208_v017158 [Fusarium oxysporum f. sp. rapae]|uniref:DUF3295 domain-containing protein n=1 Tax=Fusarium oxysporum f. sp. rapae TaxID=485398 RepID=A0A8J5TWV2_FUSOX|nr:Uncharacterized protein Forpe1208_v017081 [Fusarium oxysporum f. sp. rapae]KAG7402590.1 Uncharacterized protein Forpe1208_v017158 [Fusarium oxysporum f. sp. rapae]
MFCYLNTHILTVDANGIRMVDTGNPASLCSIWTAFSRCADFVEQGRRLENLTWRLWQREIARSRSRVRRQNPYAGTQSKREGHISSDDFEKMTVSIAQDKSPLSAFPRLALVIKEPVPAPPAFERPGSTTTESQSPTKSPITAPEGSPQPSPQNLLRTTVVRGFSPSTISTPQTVCGAAQTSDATPEPKSSPAAKVVQTEKFAWFALGGSCPPSEQDQSLNNSKPIISINKSPVFQIGGSSEEDGSLESAVASSRPSSLLSAPENQASFSQNGMTRTIDDEDAVDSDTDDYIDESAIDDDDDSSDWEDSMEASGKSSMDDKFFQRVDVKRNLTSRRSLITLGLAQNDDVHNLGNRASQSTLAVPESNSPNCLSPSASSDDSDEGSLLMKGIRGPGLKPLHEVPGSSAQPIMTGPNPTQPQAAMLATELTESPRCRLLREQQEKASTANAGLKQGHTSHDVTSLEQYPEKPYMKQSEDVNASSWNNYISETVIEGYHSKGW